MVASDKDGRPVEPTDHKAVKFSLQGAIVRVAPPLLAIAALEKIGGCDIPSIQNRFTHESLLALIDSATTWLEDWE